MKKAVTSILLKDTMIIGNPITTRIILIYP